MNITVLGIGAFTMSWVNCSDVWKTQVTVEEPMVLGSRWQLCDSDGDPREPGETAGPHIKPPWA